MDKELPVAPSAIGNYVTYKKVGNYIYTSGHVPFTEKKKYQGKIPSEVSIEDGYEAASLCAELTISTLLANGEIENLQISSKGPGDFVTSADKRTEKIIIEELQKAHPDYGIITEESGIINKANTKNRWIIDPIDGTTNFLNGIPQFAISIGYEEENEIKCGVIFDPIKNEMFCAEKGNGAYLNNARIRVSSKRQMKDALLVTGGPKGASKIKDKIFSGLNFKSLSSVKSYGTGLAPVKLIMDS